MKKSLLEVLFSSEKRKKLLVLLWKGPIDMDTILKTLNTSRQALLPQIRILEDHHLITGSKDVYELSIIGKSIVSKMVPVVDTFGAFDTDISYWGTHKLDFIPPHILKRMCELGKCRIASDSVPDMYNINAHYFETCKQSAYSSGFTTSFYPEIEDILSEMIQSQVKLNIIIPEVLLDKIKTYHKDSFESFLETGYLKLYLYKEEVEVLSFSFNDCTLIMRLLRNDGEYDNTYVACSEPSALEWANDLLKYYMENSLRITEL